MNAQLQKQMAKQVLITVTKHSMNIISGCGSRDKNKSQSLGAKYLSFRLYAKLLEI
jgi:hypothetical protein